MNSSLATIDFHLGYLNWPFLKCQFVPRPLFGWMHSCFFNTIHPDTFYVLLGFFRSERFPLQGAVNIRRRDDTVFEGFYKDGLPHGFFRHLNTFGDLEFFGCFNRYCSTIFSQHGWKKKKNGRKQKALSDCKQMNPRKKRCWKNRHFLPVKRRTSMAQNSKGKGSIQRWKCH